MNLKEYLAQQYTEQTANTYGRNIESYIRNSPDADKAFHKDIVQYIGRLRERYSGRTINTKLCAIKAYYDYLSHTGRRKDNPAKSIRLRDRQNRDIQLQDLFTGEELESLLDETERTALLSRRNRVVTSLLIYQGLLLGELESLRIEDINLVRGTVYVRGTPKTNARELPLKPGQIMLLHEYLHETRTKLDKKKRGEASLLLGTRGNPMLGEDIAKHLRRRFKGKIKGRQVNVTTIRQSVIANLLKTGHDLRVVQVFAGHKYPSATEKYKQSGVEALKTAIQKYHPLQ